MTFNADDPDEQINEALYGYAEMADSLRMRRPGEIGAVACQLTLFNRDDVV